MSFLHDILGSREKDIYLGVSGSLATLPSMIGPVVGGFIARALELRGVFLSSAIICAVSIVPLLGAKRLSISSR